MKSLEKADKIIHFFDKSHRHRWDVFKNILKSYLDKDTSWIDLGCGDNHLVKEFGVLARSAIGVDLLEPEDNTSPFIKSNIRSLPFEDNSIDLITMRFVIEHIENIERDLADAKRILKSGGKLILITTNLWNPFIQLASFVPWRIKHKIITKLFKVDDEDVFPTYHQFNNPSKFKGGLNGLFPKEIIYISDINYINNITFAIFLVWHLFTNILNLKIFRTNLIGVFEKK
jgi:ubiquinone/menaquinone biosynthesis C-methylase UbiE